MKYSVQLIDFNKQLGGAELVPVDKKETVETVVEETVETVVDEQKPIEETVVEETVVEETVVDEEPSDQKIEIIKNNPRDTFFLIKKLKESLDEREEEVTILTNEVAVLTDKLQKREEEVAVLIEDIAKQKKCTIGRALGFSS